MSKEKVKQIEVYLYSETEFGPYIYSSYLKFKVKKGTKNLVFLDLFKKQGKDFQDIIYNEGLDDIHKANYFKWLLLKKGKWVYGEYKAHEYDEERQYVSGKARLLIYYDETGIIHQTIEVKCLEKDYVVLDGEWEYSTGMLGNGFGDYFEPFGKL